jgi:hypothetical protein
LVRHDVLENSHYRVSSRTPPRRPPRRGHFFGAPSPKKRGLFSGAKFIFACRADIEPAALAPETKNPAMFRPVFRLTVGISPAGTWCLEPLRPKFMRGFFPSGRRGIWRPLAALRRNDQC